MSQSRSQENPAVDPRFLELDDLEDQLHQAIAGLAAPEGGPRVDTGRVEDLKPRINTLKDDLVIDLGGGGVLDLPSPGPGTN
ncbi:hypothetical protein GONAM_15_01230 [Gordonia namibiensis NBRC 108229]|uniref:Uncharacterized protein n=1 Tax=Gordonia namibiensis NBRC 108229 TaxID=1208314 RepID=K6VW21_9ACTN|nr:hypothetical protein GONAM_15_01230 [Gordonia namibiensis NBRC 108229]